VLDLPAQLVGQAQDIYPRQRKRAGSITVDAYSFAIQPRLPAL
jgi:hypothetical protein